MSSGSVVSMCNNCDNQFQSRHNVSGHSAQEYEAVESVPGVFAGEDI